MKTTLTLTQRNLTVFFRDVGAVSLSLVASLVLFVLYVGFLGGLQVDSLQAQFPDASVDNINWFVSTWVFAGIVMITTVTTGIAGLGTFVSDRSSGRYRDFLVAPVKSWQLIAGYMVSSALVAIVMSGVVLLIGESYLLARGYPVAGALAMLQTLGYIVLLSLTFSGVSAFVVTFIKSIGAFAALSTVVGTLVGFLAGAYLPLGLLPPAVVNAINVLPFSQASMLIRIPLTEPAIEAVTGNQVQAVAAVRAFYGVDLSVGDFAITQGLAVGLLFAVMVVFATVATLRIRKVLQK
ncbi:ABC transporter permease [Demequina lutea]|uniref:Multidrug/hemolysin transport system permease protein n=1 Tax=Demequina lutea TaxID=431489 RepID=A0A7Z0CLE7_9MICO|nr:ABC transporter permease [Demequina lutea]NYI42838.1 multidrug/hemolysin transport system permease protein [Demequina lutea]